MSSQAQGATPARSSGTGLWRPSPRAFVNTPQPAPALAPDAAPNPAVVDTLNGDPNGLRRADLDKALQATLASLGACLQQGATGPSSVGLTFDADPTGQPVNIKVTGAGPQAEPCLTGALGAMRVPPFQGKAVTVQFPLNVSRPVPAPAAPGSAAGQTAPGTPPAPSPPAGSTTPYVPAATTKPQTGPFIQP